MSDGVLRIHAEELHIISDEIKERLVPIEAFLAALVDNRAFEKEIGNDLDLTEVRALRKYLQSTDITTKNVNMYKNELNYYKMFIMCFLFNKNILEEYKKMKIERELDENHNKTMKYVKTIFLFIIVMLIAFCVLTVIVVICKWFMRKKRPLQE
ncbi:hypothetical protein THOM_1037 [Trachipleistophora hominis]|uniref:Uncharacterized protein n=1 Tax=Trachipleistophora hominis TaxID=72359 RepID=L7JZ05_TRAHO|nr:hypothetical protein THOM_1037 [Trachipleistophora hominis]